MSRHKAREYLDSLKNFFICFCFKNFIFIRSAQLILMLFLIILMTPGSAYTFDGSKYQEVCSRTLDLLHGGFGALLMASAGVGAVVAAAAGGFRLAWALVVVAVGAFTLKEYQEIWFEPC